jgi:hypothetical protein
MDLSQIPKELIEAIRKKAEEYTRSHFQSPAEATVLIIENAITAGVILGLEWASRDKLRW